jgi:RNA polymerase sigma-70 factor (ECF subfamily)
MNQGETARIHLWVERMRAGDQGALNELIIHFERRLRSLTRKMIRDYPLVHSCEQTDDVYQKAVLRLCRALKALTPGSTRDLIRLSAAQVRRELLNLARFYRSRPDLLHRRELARQALLDGTERYGATCPRVSDWLQSQDDVLLLDKWTDFHEAAAGLAEPSREVFDLIWYQGMTFEEVSRIQQVSVRTVRNRWNRARLSIYDALDGNLPGT